MIERTTGEESSLRTRLVRRLLVLGSAALLSVPAGLGGQAMFSGATFVSSSLNAPSTVRAAADWTPPTIALADPGSPVQGNLVLSATANDAETGIASVAFEVAPAGTAGWRTVCTVTVAPYTCSWSTTPAPDGSYDLRARAVDGTGLSTFSATRTTTVVNTLGLVLAHPGSAVRGTTNLTATLSNGGGATYAVRFERAAAGGSAWTTLCTTSVAPYTCSWVTPSVANGSYDLRAVATAGTATATSAVVAGVLVDNLAPVVSMVDPGSPLSGTRTLQANASDAHSGIAQVVIQVAPDGSSSYATACVLTVAPFTCSYDTKALADGAYTFRAVATDVAGNSTTSAPVTNRVVDNTPLRGLDVQTANGTGTAGRLDQGDTITFTYSGPVSLTSITSGWTGSALPVTVRLRDGALLGLGTSGDTVDVQRTGYAVNLGSVNLNQNYVTANQTVVYNATMTAGTVTVNGVPRTTVTLTVGTAVSGTGSLRTVSAASTTVWTPSTAATGPTGTPVAGTAVSETGTADREF